MALRPAAPRSQADKLAQRDAAQQDVFLREVDDALREDEMMRAIRHYGRVAAIVVAALLLALAGYLWWGKHREDQAATRAENFTLALDQLDAGNLAAASSQLAPIAGDSDDGSRAAAKLLQADIALKQGSKDQAIALYAGVAADSAAPQPYRDLATIREVATRFDSMKPEDVVARLRPLAIPGGPWFGSAGELLGMAYLQQGHKDLAAPLFGAIARDKTVPDSLRARCRQIAGLLGFDAVDDVARDHAAPAGTQTDTQG